MEKEGLRKARRRKLCVATKIDNTLLVPEELFKNNVAVRIAYEWHFLSNKTFANSKR